MQQAPSIKLSNFVHFGDGVTDKNSNDIPAVSACLPCDDKNGSTPFAAHISVIKMICDTPRSNLTEETMEI